MAQANKIFDLSARPPHAAAKPVLPQPANLHGSDPFAQESQQTEHIPRKLVRPTLPPHLAAMPLAPRRLRGHNPLAQHDGQSPQLRKSAVAAASHAEALYLQKQIQTRTPLVFVLEDGEKVEGVVEWFDRDSIKVRNASRTLIFKRRIKYLYKAKEDDL